MRATGVFATRQKSFINPKRFSPVEGSMNVQTVLFLAPVSLEITEWWMTLFFFILTKTGSSSLSIVPPGMKDQLV